MMFGMPFLMETATVDDAAALCRELGLSFVELNLNFPACDLAALDLPRLRRMKAEGVGFTIHMDEDCDPFSFNADVRRAWLTSIRKAAAAAQMLDAPILNMHLPRGVYITLPDRKAVLYEHYRREYMDAVRQLRDLCDEELRGSGTRIGIENTGGFLPHEQAAIDELMTSPVFGLTLDVGHSHAIGDADLPFYRARDGRLIHMHFHDGKGEHPHLPLGAGEIDLRGRLAWAAERDATVVIEVKTVQALRESVQRLADYLPETSFFC